MAVVLLAACGGSEKADPGSTTTTTSVNQLSSPLYDQAGPTPSISAKMVCQKSAREDIEANLGMRVQKITTPVWNEAEHRYACTYVYPKGRITLIVKEFSNEKETTAYFEDTKKQYGVTQQLNGLGQGAFILKNNFVLVRKDYKTLLVDVSKIPGNFAPAMTRSDVALNIGVAVMGCWIGA